MRFNPEVPMEDGYYYAHANFAKSSIVILMRDTLDCMDGTYEVVWYAMGNESPLRTEILDRIRFGEKVPIPTKSTTPLFLRLRDYVKRVVRRAKRKKE